MRPTIKDYARELLLRVNFVDVNGRNVGYDYSHVLTQIKKKFPSAQTTPRLLWWEVTSLRTEGHRVPARRKSRRVAARDYIRALLMEVGPDGYGLPDKVIKKKVRARFPDVRFLSSRYRVPYWRTNSLIQVRNHMVRDEGLNPPPRPPRETAACQ